MAPSTGAFAPRLSTLAEKVTGAPADTIPGSGRTPTERRWSASRVKGRTASTHSEEPAEPSGHTTTRKR